MYVIRTYYNNFDINLGRVSTNITEIQLSCLLLAGLMLSVRLRSIMTGDPSGCQHLGRQPILLDKSQSFETTYKHTLYFSPEIKLSYDYCLISRQCMEALGSLLKTWLYAQLIFRC